MTQETNPSMSYYEVFSVFRDVKTLKIQLLNLSELMFRLFLKTVEVWWITF